ncbi:CbiX/SirB N-terminal domain-containing protein [Corynebacterium kroppenstedtii]|uniref:sirohydrochlorin chelatase n=1 Tax=Corynebacterium kroppenstedtii TaxID=161879 RepID=UPI0026F23F69|nr:CbiX/SirB N-terminal domain-containing protein [Corynebacterium kroppenstedtii]
MNQSASKGLGSACPGSTRSALILLAHGSRHNHVTHALRDITDAVAREYRIAGRFGVHMAFLDHAEPDLVQVSARLAERGYDRAVVVPLLFTDAFHSRVDVPAQVNKAQDASGLAMSITRGLGTGDDLAAVLEQRFSRLVPEASSSGSGLTAGSEANGGASAVVDGSSVRATENMLGPGNTPAPVIRVLYSVGSSDPAANDAVSRLAASIGATSVAATGEHPKGVAAIDHIVAHHGNANQGGLDQGKRKKDQVATESGELSADPLVVVQPLFVAPGKLWAMATKELAHRQSQSQSVETQPLRERLTFRRGDIPEMLGYSYETPDVPDVRFRCGSPLGVDLAPMIADRACSA